MKNLVAGRKCRKCADKCTRRRAGVFSCKRCGVQPGQAHYDRCGLTKSEMEQREQINA